MGLRENILSSRFDQKTIAKQAGCSEATISSIVAGTRKARKALERKILAACAGESPPPPLPPPAPAPARDHSPGDVTAAALETMGVLREQLRRADSDVMPTVANSLLNSIKVLAKLTGQLEITEAAILRSPAWRRVSEAMFDSLIPFPDALAAVVDALAKLDGKAPHISPNASGSVSP
jgi:uncharacterized membrane protein